MKHHLAKPLAALVLSLVAGFAQASTVTFTAPKGTYSSYKDTADGFLFTSSFFSLTGTALTESLGQTLTVSTISGQAFDLDSLQLDGSSLLGLKSTVVLGYTEADGDKGSITLALDSKNGFQTFEEGLDDITSFTLTGSNLFTSFTLDNLVTSPYVAPPVPPVSTVPEPASLGLMAAGLAMLGLTRRRRRGA